MLLSLDKIILVALLCFYNVFLKQQFPDVVSFHLWLQEDHSVLLSGPRHDKKHEAPKIFSFFSFTSVKDT